MIVTLEKNVEFATLELFYLNMLGYDKSAYRKHNSPES